MSELITNLKSNESNVNDYLNRVEAAAYCRVPVSTFDFLRKTFQVPDHEAQVGKHKLWRKSTLDNFLASGGSNGDWQ